jgi:hypothetical protein
MLLSRFWYVFLAVAAAAATAAALLAQSVINARTDEALADSLARDRVMIEAMLRLEARSRLDRIAFITVDSKLGALLRQAHDLTDEKKLREASGQVKELMRGHVARIVEAAGEGSADDKRELEPDIAFALDGQGRIIGQLGPMEANPPGAGLGAFPLVRRALQGYLRDDVWLYDRRVYRMAARPVMFGTEYAGAIVHGYRLEKGLTEKLSKNVGGATVAFFYGTDVLGTYVPGDVSGSPQQAELATALPKVLADKQFAQGSKGVVSLQNGGRAVFMPVNGSAAAAGVGYVIARPRRLIGSPDQLFQQASQDDVKGLPVLYLVGGALLLALIGLLSLYLERDRHMKALMTKTAEIAAGSRDRLIVTEWRGAYRKLADRINQAIEKEVERAGDRAPSTRKKANLDEILGPTPEASATPFFGFASEPDAPVPPPPAPPPAPNSGPATARGGAALPGSSASRTRAPAAAPAAAAPMMSMPAPSLLPDAPSPPPPPPRGGGAPPPPTASGGGDNGASFDEDAHWRDVYEQYVATRKQCGESIDNLTFEKFGLTLRKTRDQILEKHGARSVRFTVQVKEGKAALKAQPIKR